MIPPRAAVPTITFVDAYCANYAHLFSEVRTFENFKYLHVGIISDIPHKSLPAIARVVGLHDSQPLQNFLTDSPWSVIELRNYRIALALKMLNGQPFKLIIDETGDRKKGRHTNYVTRQYIGNLGKIENGIVSVNAYGVLGDITFPLMFKIYRPKSTLKEGDIYKSKPQIAGEIIEELQTMGCKFDLVLADSLYGESGNLIKILQKFELSYVLAIRSNHAVWLREGQEVTCGEWQDFMRIFTDGTIQKRYIAEIIFGVRRGVTYWQITTDHEQLPANQIGALFARILHPGEKRTEYVMTNLTGNFLLKLGNLYGFRNWIEYAFKQAKNELGWADFRFTNYEAIEKWWEVVMSAYLMVSLQTIERQPKQTPETAIDFESLASFEASANVEPPKLREHIWWNFQTGWKSTLNNLRLLIQPYIFFNLLKPWLLIFEIPHLKFGFGKLIDMMNEFQGYKFFNSE